ncbi:DUF3993 domain-containing protein [Rossellomorea sp. BNER]|uniref:DUF3993 domain-containing protein n=1 Tax=Rossellomorea sp. BNER TaxID=2962031 RepID=UPI003AF20676|nr:DUF3993 domain-containing protein [Rossellomorea sp. BNER]
MKTRKLLFLTVIMFSLLLTGFQPASAAEPVKTEMVTHVKEAFNAQVSLSEKPRSLSQIKNILDEHFTDEFQKKFIRDNVVQGEGGYFTLGADFAPHYIPFFKYEQMEMVLHDDKLYVMEYLTYEEGPFSFENGYEAVVFVKEHGKWKINDITSQIPEKILPYLNGESVSQNEQKDSSNEEVLKPAEKVNGSDQSPITLGLDSTKKEGFSVYTVFQTYLPQWVENCLQLKEYFNKNNFQSLDTL